MKTLLESNNLWEFAFGDIGELANQDDDEVECSSETDKITTATQELYSEEAAAMEYCIEDEKEEHDNVLQVLETFEKKEIITSEANIKLATVYKSKNFSTGGKTTIPTYKLTESENKERQKFKKDKKFIEIIHNGESVFVRKTTLVWLFQEGERISNDRLFRIRLKQPFNKTLQDDASQSEDSSLPVVNEHISLGDICVFRTPKSISSELFRIGRVTHFAYYKERLKKDRQFKNTIAKIQSSVGALCSWYHPAKENSQLFVHIPNENPNYVSLSDSYVCTLFFSCFQEVKGTEIKGMQLGPLPLQSVLHTARELVISKSAYNFINKIVSDPPQSKQIITIKENSSESITTKSRSDMWVTCNGYRLYNKNKQQLLNGRELTDMHMDGALVLLKQQYPEIGGLQSTLYQQSDKPLLQPNNAIQVIHILPQHWATISTIGCEENTVELYDSVFNTISLSIKKQLSNC